MVKLRPLKPHEQKLVKKVDFYNWKNENPREERRTLLAIQKYGLRDRTEFRRYQRIASQVNDCIKGLRRLPSNDHYVAFKREQLERVAAKLHEMGVLDSPDELQKMKTVPAERFCRRRLSTVLKMRDMAPTIQQAELFILHGHVRVGPEVINDPAFIVTRAMEDFLTWSNASKIRRTIASYRGEVDDYDLLGA